MPNELHQSESAKEGAKALPSETATKCAHFYFAVLLSESYRYQTYSLATFPWSLIDMVSARYLNHSHPTFSKLAKQTLRLQLRCIQLMVSTFRHFLPTLLETFLGAWGAWQSPNAVNAFRAEPFPKDIPVRMIHALVPCPSFFCGDSWQLIPYSLFLRIPKSTKSGSWLYTSLHPFSEVSSQPKEL